MRLHGSYSRTWIKGYNPLNHPNSYGSEFNPKKPSLSIGMELSKALIKYFRLSEAKKHSPWTMRYINRSGNIDITADKYTRRIIRIVIKGNQVDNYFKNKAK